MVQLLHFINSVVNLSELLYTFQIKIPLTASNMKLIKFITTF